MGDRYGDRYDSYDPYDRYDSYDDYGDDYGNYRSDRYTSGGSRRSQQSSGSRDRNSGAYRSSDSRGDSYRRSSGSRGRELSQSSDARYHSKSSNLFDEYYPDDGIDAYRAPYSPSTSSNYYSRSSSYHGQSRSYDRSNRATTRSSAARDVSYNGGTGDRNRTYRSSLESSPAMQQSSTRRRPAEDSRVSRTAVIDPAPRARNNRVDYDTRANYGSRNGGYDSRGRGYEGYDDYDDYDDFDDYSERGRYSRDGGGYAPKRSNLKRNLIIAAVAVVVIILVGVGAAFAYMHNISENLHEGVDDDLRDALVSTDMGGEPFYMLLLGTDGSADRHDDPEFGDVERSDSMILARIDPQNKKVTLLSIDRDTLVDLGDEYGEQKINAAYELYGAAGAVKAVSAMAGVDIAHYASVDFDGFRAIVDALGGVEVEVPVDIDDPEAGGSLSAGLQTLDGDQALILCRSRHTYDDMVAAGDVIRAANQRAVLGAIAKKLLSSDVATIANTVNEVSKYVTTDMELNDIIGLAQMLQGIDPSSDIYTAAEPTESLYLDDVWYEILDEEEWAKMVARMDQGLPPKESTEIDDATGVALATSGDKAKTN